MHRSSSRIFPLLQMYRVNFRRFFYFEIFRAEVYKCLGSGHSPEPATFISERVMGTHCEYHNVNKKCVQ
jgi:hypothetical protein